MTNNIESKETIIYKDCFVAFLDILGFTKLVLSKNSDDKKRIYQYFKTVDSSIDYLKNTPVKSDIGTIVISDSVILSVIKNTDVEKNIDLFRHFCISVGLIQQKLAKEKLLLRGGISSGEAYFEETKKQIVGPAYIKSYELENEYANFPRVVIDSNIIAELGCVNAGEFIDLINRKGQGGIKYSNWSANILFDWRQDLADSGSVITHDLPLFIDYLSPNIGMRNDDLLSIIKNIRESIYESIEYYDKYRWVANYLLGIWRYQEDLDPSIENELENL
jgi:hypothetical protein